MSETKKAGTASSTQTKRGGAVVPRGSQGPRFKPQTPISRDAQRVAAVILEVLAGVRTPTEAAAQVGLSVPRYYLWEQRALEGLVRACEPRPKGKAASERHRVAEMEKELARLRQDCARQQALVRASQRTMGLAASSGHPLAGAAKAAAKTGGKTAAKPAEAAGGKAKRKRRPVARALKAVAALQAAPAEPETAADSSSAVAVELVQRSVLDSLLQVAAEASSAVVAAQA
jgi:hypothetical protein